MLHLLHRGLTRPITAEQRGQRNARNRMARRVRGRMPMVISSNQYRTIFLVMFGHIGKHSFLTCNDRDGLNFR